MPYVVYWCVLCPHDLFCCIWLSMMDLSDLFHNKIFLWLERCWCAVSARSISTVSWSFLPNGGNALHLSMIVGCDVKSKSSVFCPRVGKITICSKARSCCMDIHSFTCLGNWWPFTVEDSQSMSGRLKPPPRMTYEDWYCDLTVVMSFTSCSMYSPSVLWAADMMTAFPWSSFT